MPTAALAPPPPIAAPDCPCAAPAGQDAGDFFAWVGRLVHQHRDRLIRVARREGVTGADAFDVVQEAFGTFLTLPQARALAAARHTRRVEARGEPARLLAALARNAARNRRRLFAVARPHDSHDAALDALPAAAPSVDELVVAAEEVVKLRGCVQSLGDVQRTVVTLRMLDEIDGADVARALGMTPGHVAVLLHRAKANLQACMTAPHPGRA